LLHLYRSAFSCAETRVFLWFIGEVVQKHLLACKENPLGGFPDQVNVDVKKYLFVTALLKFGFASHSRRLCLYRYTKVLMFY